MSTPSRLLRGCPPPAGNLAAVTTRLAVVLLAATAVAAASAPPAPASHGTSCGIVSKGSSDYRVTGRVIKCRSARKWVRRYLSNRDRPSGWSCVDPAGSVRVYCSRGSKAYWATRL
jgi:hypothetical protein